MWSTSAGTGVPLVLIHGAVSDYRSWELQQISFARRYRTIALSLPGYYPDYAAVAGDVPNVDRHADDVVKFLTELGEPAHVVGHSRGGRVALHVAVRIPQQVRSLILAEPGGALAPDFLPPAAPLAAPSHGIDFRKEGLALIQRGELEVGLRLFFDAGHGQGVWERSPEIFRRVARANAATLAVTMTDNSAQLTHDVAGHVRAPTLLVDGAESPPLFGQVVTVLQSRIKNARRVTIPGANHFMNLVRPEEFSRVVLEFLAGQPV